MLRRHRLANLFAENFYVNDEENVDDRENGEGTMANGLMDNRHLGILLVL